MKLKEELKEIEFAMKSAVGWGNRGAVTHKRDSFVERPRCEDAKRHSLYKAAGQLRSGAAKLFDVREFVKLFSLSNCKISSLLGRESNCSSATSYSCERGVDKNTDRATECAMTNISADFLKIIRHSEDNNFLSPKNLLKELQEDLSLNAQDDERDFLQKSLAVCTAAVSVGRHCYADTKLKNV